MASLVAAQPGPDLCSLCAKPASLRCTACKTVCYCSKEHQRQDWKAHKVQCRLVQKDASDQMAATNSSHWEQSPAYRAANAFPPAQRERAMFRLAEAGDAWAQLNSGHIIRLRADAADARGDTHAADEDYLRAAPWVRRACVRAP